MMETPSPMMAAMQSDHQSGVNSSAGEELSGRGDSKAADNQMGTTQLVTRNVRDSKARDCPNKKAEGEHTHSSPPCMQNAAAPALPSIKSALDNVHYMFYGSSRMPGLWDH